MGILLVQCDCCGKILPDNDDSSWIFDNVEGAQIIKCGDCYLAEYPDPLYQEDREITDLFGKTMINAIRKRERLWGDQE